MCRYLCTKAHSSSAQPGLNVTHTEIPTILQTSDLQHSRGNEEQINYMWELEILREIVELQMPEL